MKKIDLHIHTKSTNQDNGFTFCIDKMKQYVTDAKLDCIAITNHNFFDKTQFYLIVKELDILVLPGIEVDVEDFHLLVIHKNSDIEKFDAICSDIHKNWIDHNNSMRCNLLIEKLGNPNDYILIPHYQKDPKIRPEFISLFGRNIFCGEVSSPKKFISCIKDRETLVPLFFSDCRISNELNPLPTKQTYVDCGGLTFGSLKEALRDKRKVALSRNHGNNLLEIFPDGQKVSTGLNVILGDRSSGKSHTLRRIFEWFGDENTEYIRQFDLVARNDAEDEKKFKDYLTENTSIYSRDYLSNLQTIVDDIISIDIDADLNSLDKYLISLKEHAQEKSKQDIFSKAKLYSEDEFPIKNLEGLIKLVESTKHLLSNIEYRNIINKHLSQDSIKSLYLDLMQTYGEENEINAKKEWINSLISDIKSKLQRKSSATMIKEVNLLSVALNKRKVERFREVVETARRPKTPLRKKKRGFEVVAEIGPFRRAAELKEISRSNRAFSNAYNKYDDPYLFINELKKIGDPVEAASYAKYLVKVEYKILNKFGHDASGGERSEFFLLDKIERADGADALLIDEPESSFDNNFLRADVNEIIKEMSKKMPVIIVTHNNTVGASIQPDYLLYTKKDANGSEVHWNIFSGKPTDQVLKSVDGLEISTRDVLLGNLEAGVEAYEQRSMTYENLKN